MGLPTRLSTVSVRRRARISYWHGVSVFGYSPSSGTVSYLSPICSTLCWVWIAAVETTETATEELLLAIWWRCGSSGVGTPAASRVGRPYSVGSLPYEHHARRVIARRSSMPTTRRPRLLQNRPFADERMETRGRVSIRVPAQVRVLSYPGSHTARNPSTCVRQSGPAGPCPLYHALFCSGNAPSRPL